MEEIMSLLSKVPTSTAIAFTMGIITIIVGVNALVVKAFAYFEKWHKERTEEERKEELINSIAELKVSLDNLGNGVKMLLADKLNERCRHYTSIEYIPEEEWEEFNKEHEAYKDLKGNSMIDAKFNKVVNSFPIK